MGQVPSFKLGVAQEGGVFAAKLTFVSQHLWCLVSALMRRLAVRLSLVTVQDEV
jgi:hypothetical protein